MKTKPRPKQQFKELPREKCPECKEWKRGEESICCFCNLCMDDCCKCPEWKEVAP